MNYDNIEIVLVEDNPDDAELTMRALKSMKVQNNILWLKDGEEALDFFFARNKYRERDLSINPKVVLLDLKLPKVSGHEILKAIKSSSDIKNIPIVIMTSSEEIVDLKECYSNGANSYVVKPISFEDFTRATKDISLYWMLTNQLPN
ncbi:response regulator [Reichenbachiella agarivorans]|uniref:Response regulator n=1 Tax=Reichenbachiella agarivorans TaxID=2979464 RepID=A0ABY6CR94_9BACT|nr:response regulator [Reichenbachiella agarivorans]UXP30825.1 response regulator [Reichenbachiella agarivorans]